MMASHRLSMRTWMLGPFLLSFLLALCASIGIAGEGAPEQKGETLDKGDIKGLLRQAIQSGDESNLTELLRKLAKMRGDAAAAAVLSVADSLAPEEEVNYWFLLGAVGTFVSPDAYSEAGDFVVKSKSKAISRDLMQALQQQPSKRKYMARVVRRVLEGAPQDLQLMALDLAGQVPYRRTVDVLLDFYEGEDQRKPGDISPLRERLVAALEGLTLKRFGDNYPNWRGWWDAHRHRGLKILRLEAEQGGGTTGVSQPIDPVRAREFAPESMPPGKVLVIKAPIDKRQRDVNFDHIEQVLSGMRVPHDVVEKTRIAEGSVKLEKYAAVFINCSQIHAYCQSEGHQGGEAVGNRLNRCLGPAPHDQAHFGWWCGDSCSINGCSAAHPAILKVKKWVEAGGHLFTEDWVLIEVLEPAWPKLVTRGAKLSGKTVEIQAGKGVGSHPLLRGVFVPPVNLDDVEFEEEEDEEKFKKSYVATDEDDPDDTDTAGKTGVDKETAGAPLEEDEEAEIRRIKHTWKIDDESHAIDVKSKDVVVLMSSEQLRKDCGQRAVAVLFNAGRGRVLHILSHFGKQESAKDEATIENLLINFLLEVNIYPD